MHTAILIKFYVCPDVFPSEFPMELWKKKKKWGKGKSENARFSFLMKNTLSISLKMSLLFASLLPLA